MAKPLIGKQFDEAAERYALADNSDPFAFARAKTHLANGIASFANANGEAAYYSADEGTELRQITMPNGEKLEWHATVYRNRFRP
jgi:hypothetical protein